MISSSRSATTTGPGQAGQGRARMARARMARVGACTHLAVSIAVVLGSLGVEVDGLHGAHEGIPHAHPVLVRWGGVA